MAPEEAAERIYGWDLPKAIQRPYNSGNARRGTAEWWRRPPRLHYWAVAPEYNLLDELKRCFMRAIPGELIEHQNTGANSWWLKPDILLEFKSAKHWDNLRSVGLNGLILDEAARIHPRAWVDSLRPCLSDKGGWLIAISTPTGRNWFYDELIKLAEEGEQGYSYHTWKTIDNAIHNDIAPLLADIDLARKTLPDEFFKREYEASLDAFMGQIYMEWDDERFSLPVLPQGIQFRRILGGADWGFANPGCLGVVGFTETSAYRLDETYRKSELVEDFWAPEALRLMDEYHFDEWVCDPAEPDNLMRFRNAGRNKGISVVGHRNYGSGKFDEHARNVMSGIRQMASAIHQGRLYCIKDRTRDFRREMSTYHWDNSPSAAKEQYGSVDTLGLIERPAPHQPDHAVTTQRYCMTYDGKPSALRALS